MAEWLLNLKEVNYQLYTIIEAGMLFGAFLGIPFLVVGCMTLLDKIKKKIDRH